LSIWHVFFAEMIGKYCHLVKVHPVLVCFSFSSTAYDLVYRIIVKTELYLTFMLHRSWKLYVVNKKCINTQLIGVIRFVGSNVLMQCAAGRIQ
jgi:hypothetical protein